MKNLLIVFCFLLGISLQVKASEHHFSDFTELFQSLTSGKTHYTKDVTVLLSSKNISFTDSSQKVAEEEFYTCQYQIAQACPSQETMENCCPFRRWSYSLFYNSVRAKTIMTIGNDKFDWNGLMETNKRHGTDIVTDIEHIQNISFTWRLNGVENASSRRVARNLFAEIEKLVDVNKIALLETKTQNKLDVRRWGIERGITYTLTRNFDKKINAHVVSFTGRIREDEVKAL